MGLAYLIVGIVASAFAGRAIKMPSIDGDLWWQKHLGAYVVAHRALPTALGNETFTAAGAPWTPHEWLLGLAVWYASQTSTAWVLGVTAALALAIAMLVSASRGRRFGASPPAIAVCTCLLAVNLEGSYGIRAQVFAWPLFATMLWLLDLETPAAFLALPAIVAWANVHASVMLAIPIVWLDAGVRLVRSGVRNRVVRQRLLLSALAPLAVMATPLGVKLPLYALMLLGNPITRSIQEWQPVSGRDDYFWFGGAPMLVLCVAYGRTLFRERPRDVVWSAALAVMALFAVRNVALFGLAAMPLTARALDVMLARFSWWPFDPLRSEGPRRLAIAGGIVMSALVLIVTLKLPAPKDAWRAPFATFDRVSAIPGVHDVFCYDFAVCSVALDYPNLRVFLDGRADPYPLPVWNAFNAIRRTQPGWRKLMAAYDVDTVLAKRNDKLDAALSHDKSWRRLPAVDPCCYAYVKR